MRQSAGDLPIDFVVRPVAIAQLEADSAALKSTTLTLNEEMAECIRRQIRHGEEGSCTCGECKDLIPQRKQELESLAQEANLLRMETAPGKVQAENINCTATLDSALQSLQLTVSTVVGDVRNGRLNHAEADSVIAEVVGAIQEYASDAQVNVRVPWLRMCRVRLARAGFPIVLFPRLGVLLESCVAAKSEPILVDGLDLLLAKYLQRARSTARWRCDIEYALKVVALVPSCAGDDAKETVQRGASRCWWLLIFAARVLKLVTNIRDLLDGR